MVSKRKAFLVGCSWVNDVYVLKQQITEDLASVTGSLVWAPECPQMPMLRLPRGK